MKAPGEPIYGKSTHGTKPNVEKVHSVDYNAVVDNTGLSRLAVVVSQIYEIPRHSPKIRTYSSSWSKVIDLAVNRKRICEFMLVINNNFRCISPIVFTDIHQILTFKFKMACFPTFLV